jgi:hypothetical protein
MAFCCAVCGEETVSGQLGSQTRDVTEALYVILSKRFDDFSVSTIYDQFICV